MPNLRNMLLPIAGINDFPHAAEEDVQAALPTLAEVGVPLLAHAELISELPPSQVGNSSQNHDSANRSTCPRRKQSVVFLLKYVLLMRDGVSSARTC